MRDENLSIGIIGCGDTALAVIDGLLAKQVVTNPSLIQCSDIHAPSLDRASKKGVQTTTSNQEVCTSASDVILLAVNSSEIEDVCHEVFKIPSKALIISVVAGTTLETLESALPGRKVVRAMPNSPCIVGQASTGFCLGALCTPDDRSLVMRIFGSVGTAHEMSSELLLNAVTGLSGSGPAYVLTFIEALADGGVRSGLPRDVATQLAAQTVKGAAELVLKTGLHPAQLKENVESPDGTAIAGMEALESGRGFRSATIQAVTAATKRSMQLGNIKEEEIRNVHNLW